MTIKLSSALALGLAVQVTHAFEPNAAASEWKRVLLNETDAPIKEIAVCIDGSPGAFYVKPGVGENATKFVLFFEGGGWATSLQDSYDRSKTPLGSSNTYAPITTAWAARDILDTDCAKNYQYCNWSSVYAPYCDGASRAGHAHIVKYGEHDLHFHGFDILCGMMDVLLSADGPGAGAPSLAAASHLLISGSSAGGLTTYLHADYIASRVAALNASTIVKAAPEVGFFIDGASIWGGEHIMTQAFQAVAGFQNVTGGNPGQVNEDCVARTPEADRWKCFMAQYTYPFIKTPVFIINSAVDEWQTQHILAPNTNITVSVQPYAPFAPCILNPVAGCNATQAAQWTNYSKQFFTALGQAQAATPASILAQNGGAITSCPIHTTMIGGLSHRIKMNGPNGPVSLYEQLAAWFFETQGTGAGTYWLYDVPYPGNDSCPKPSELGDDIEMAAQ